MKTKLELIKNYPIEALKNWGDYFGYPEGICKEMIDMVDCDWQNTKIGVLDDFGFQMFKYLLNVKKVPLQNIYFLVSEEEDSVVFEKINKWYSSFVENKIFSIYNINDMSFDLIIANPPYGKSSSLSKKIVNKMLENKVAKEMVVLAPPKTYEDCIAFVSELGWSGQTSEVFDIPGANAQLITVAKLMDNKSDRIPVDDLYLSRKQQQLKAAVARYNTTHVSFYKELIQQMTISRKSKYAYLKDELIFVVPIWTPLDGVHACDSSDRRHNLERKPVTWKDSSSGDYGIYFEDEIKLKNFTDWWYAKPGRSVEAQKSLINNLLKTLSARYGKGCSIEKYKEILPNLDWSHPWTDKEILKEIGLPEDFLEREDEVAK